MSLEEQRDVIERALGERMLNRAFVILHQWLQEIGFQQYGDRLLSLEHNYDVTFNYYLTTNDPDRDKVLDDLTEATYRLVDEVYAEVCLKRGRYPEMVGFNADNPQSVVNYFGSCVRLREEDMDWLRDVTIREPQPAIGLLAMASMLHVLRDAFSEDVVLCLMEIVDSENALLSEQALASTILILAHYDVRIDFFPRLQEAFHDLVNRHSERAFHVLCALVTSTRHSLKEVMNLNDIKPDELPNTLKDMLGSETTDDELEHVVSYVPQSEDDYMSGLIFVLPETWVFDAIVGDDEDRMRAISEAYLEAGTMDMWWDNLDEAEQIITEQLRSEHPIAQDYINYGHICFVRGDKLMAYENYREARRMLGSSKKFLSLFRPDRRFLIDKGLTLEDVYLMEDHLLQI